MLEERMLEQKTWAVVGVNKDHSRYGNMIYHKLKRHGYTVFAVNPRHDQVDGDVCYPSLRDLPQKPDVVNVVVGPARTLDLLEEAASLGIRYIWLQPGTYDDKVMARVLDLGLLSVHACVLVAVR
ncbi:CoA-binding protein [Anaerotalea alkaliphila]|uniref:CoA-binding protein n=1 Tax=Anaerotalea alkaliphila TaxID=2662126 RepID=A0A7X5KMY4_9FIRM|nr:CoA-binding protein [Anaerotalea alkaliphila]NDL66242.1 CoA-binding protein [Anaerotalea alkaliphila]